jgi:hypothetical protein
MTIAELKDNMAKSLQGGGSSEDAVRYGREQFDRFLDNLPAEVRNNLQDYELFPVAYYSTHEVVTGATEIKLFKQDDKIVDGYCNLESAKMPAKTYTLITHLHIAYSENTGTTRTKGKFAITAVKDEMLNSDLLIRAAGKDIAFIDTAVMLTENQDESVRSGKVLRHALPTPKWLLESQVFEATLKLFEGGMPAPESGKIHQVKGVIKGIALRPKA